MEHDGGEVSPARCETVATWPKGSFAENLAVTPSGDILVTLHTDRAVVRVDPATGTISPFATFPAPVAGLALMTDGGLVVSGGTPGQRGGFIWRVAPDGRVSPLADVPDALFLNGVTPLSSADGLFLVAESLGGMIYRIDARQGLVTPWLVDARLEPPEPNGTPGANGIKLHDGAAFISVTGADRIYRTPIIGGKPGPLALVAERLRADDFAVGADGSLFVATHPAHSLVRLGPDGVRTTLATAAQGMTGATAVAFGRREDDRRSVYVTTTGGTMTLPAERQEAAKLVRVEVGIAGASL